MQTKARRMPESIAELRRTLAKLRLDNKTKEELESELRHLETVYSAKYVSARMDGYLEGARDLAEVEAKRRQLELELKETKLASEERQSVLKRLAKLDQMTGLYNSAEFLDSIVPKYVRNVARDRRRGETDRRSEEAALWVLDLDRLKQVNDVLGHLMGNRLIDCIAKLLKESVRKRNVYPGHIHNHHLIEQVSDEAFKGDTGRLGGDEFSVLQVGMRNFQEAWFAASRIKNLYDRHAWSEDDERLAVFMPTVSVGVAVIRLQSLRALRDMNVDLNLGQAQEIAKLWFHEADKLMYRCKTGREHQPMIAGFDYDHASQTLIPRELTGSQRQEIVQLDL